MWRMFPDSRRPRGPGAMRCVGSLCIVVIFCSYQLAIKTSISKAKAKYIDSLPGLLLLKGYPKELPLPPVSASQTPL